METVKKDGIESASERGCNRDSEAISAGASVTAKHPNYDRSTTRCKALGPRQHRYLSVKSVAQRFDVSVNTIWRWARNGKFPAPVKFSGTTRWREKNLIDFENRAAQ